MNEEVGGIPYLLRLLKRFLPKDIEKRETLAQILALALTYIVYAAFNCVRYPNSVVKTRIIFQCNVTYADNWKESEFGIPEETSWCDDISGGSSVENRMGLLDALFMASYAICTFISGMLVDRYNPRYFLSAGCIFCGFIACLIGLAQTWVVEDYNYLIMCLILFGAAHSTGWPVVMSCATHWYNGSRRGLFFGFWNTHQFLGIFIASRYVEQEWGWCFYIPAFIILAMAVINFSLFVADPSDLAFLDRKKEVPLQIEDALQLPGVLEFSGCLFFTRIVGYAFMGWLPVCISVVGNLSAQQVTIYPLCFLSGACIGGLMIGILHDKFHKSAFLSSVFLLLSIPSVYIFNSICLQVHPDNSISRMFLFMWIGFITEAPVILITTSISAELGTHKLIKRDHSAMATVAGILEGTAALGQIWAPIVSGYFITEYKWIYMIYLMMVLQFLAMMCLVRLAYREFKKKTDFVFKEYVRSHSFF
ncbi:glucose-6-phosphate exchanger SLC37A2-like [Uloborus diversus]|uniref:glucose-6-phosphate exchanger SLC37A2-like n=1 Tax=Uloborus diversus TaxID=327109 RepID=UPI002409EC0D|nr:glucose-6-phosphate exchanger SLC37A2-like [Uloborus diversus]